MTSNTTTATYGKDMLTLTYPLQDQSAVLMKKERTYINEYETKLTKEL